MDEKQEERDLGLFIELIDKNFPHRTVGEKQDLVIRQWITYAGIHMEKHPCDEFKRILNIRGNQILELAKK